MLATAQTPPAEPVPVTAKESAAHLTLCAPVRLSPQAPSFLVAILCIVLVAVTLRPAIVSIGPLLPSMIQAFGLSHTQASLLTAIPTLLMGVMALPAPWAALWRRP